MTKVPSDDPVQGIRRYKSCRKCNGHGELRTVINGNWSGPEPVRCAACDGRGLIVEIPLESAE